MRNGRSLGLQGFSTGSAPLRFYAITCEMSKESDASSAVFNSVVEGGVGCVPTVFFEVNYCTGTGTERVMNGVLHHLGFRTGSCWAQPRTARR